MLSEKENVSEAGKTKIRIFCDMVDKSRGCCPNICQRVKDAALSHSPGLTISCKTSLSVSSFVICVLTNPTLEEVQEAIERVETFQKPVLMNVFYKSHEEKKMNQTGTSTIKLIAGQHNIILSEYLSDDLDIHRLQAQIGNYLYLSQLRLTNPIEAELLYTRYKKSLIIFKDIQRLLTAQGVLMTTNPTEINRVEQYKAFPTSLKPIRFAKKMYRKLQKATKVQNNLWAKIAGDKSWVLEQIKDLRKNDDFVDKLALIAEKVIKNNTHSKYKLLLARNDFMVDEENEKAIQVEFNLIASGLGILSQYHKTFAQTLEKMIGEKKEDHNQIKENWNLKTKEMFFTAFKEAFNLYGDSNAIIVYIVDEGQNTFSQEELIPWLTDAGITVRKYLFEELQDLVQYDESDGRISVLGEEVALFYFRNGYMPYQYTDKTWLLREQIEKSKAIKCPDVFAQILNFKFFQYIINKEQTWIHFGFDKQAYEASRETFANIWIFKDFDFDKQTLLSFIQNNGGYNSFVLKPQREGGANNYFGLGIKEYIENHSESEIDSNILMERIKPTIRQGIYTNFKQVILADIISEIGLFSWSLSNETEVIGEGVSDYLTRSKKLGTDEGGIHTGFAFLDSIELV